MGPMNTLFAKNRLVAPEGDEREGLFNFDTMHGAGRRMVTPQRAGGYNKVKQVCHLVLAVECTWVCFVEAVDGRCSAAQCFRCSAFIGSRFGFGLGRVPGSTSGVQCHAFCVNCLYSSSSAFLGRMTK
uniref:Uncharacterized protein n=1 Tax=Eutreptiella gymnastica TaxID=73025 RepID=A0A7S4GAS7_9EUGL